MIMPEAKSALKDGSSIATGPVIVTGAARGLGSGIAQRFAREGRSVAMWDVDEVELTKAAQTVREVAQQGATVITDKVDVTDEHVVEAAVDSTIAKLGGVTTLVNNAGILGWRGPVVDLPMEMWHKVLAVNLTGTLICSKAVSSHMLKHGYGRIVNMASIAGKEGRAFNVAYAATKAAIIGLTKSLGKELCERGVLVNCVTPSAADTSIFDHQNPEESAKIRDTLLSLVPMGRYVELEEVAELVSWLASDKCSFSTGAVFDITGGRASY